MPRHFLKSLVPKPSTRPEHVLPFLGVIAFILIFYIASVMIPAGAVTTLISLVCLSLIGLTALARLNDIPHDYTSRRWQIRRLGLILGGAACINLSVAMLTEPPQWREVMLYLGVWLTWFTTPNMPPWWRYISGQHRKVEVEVPPDVVVDVKRNPEVEMATIERRIALQGDKP